MVGGGTMVLTYYERIGVTPDDRELFLSIENRIGVHQQIYSFSGAFVRGIWSRRRVRERVLERPDACCLQVICSILLLWRGVLEGSG